MTITKEIRMELLDAYTSPSGLMSCHICRTEIDPEEDHWELDHIVPRSRVSSGCDPDVEENLHPAHADCNKRKGAKFSYREKHRFAWCELHDCNDCGIATWEEINDSTGEAILITKCLDLCGHPTTKWTRSIS